MSSGGRSQLMPGQRGCFAFQRRSQICLVCALSFAFLILAGNVSALRAGEVSTVGQPAVQSRLWARDEFPIGLWWPPPPGETNVERYREIADTGINFVIGGNGVQDMPRNRAMLVAAEANDLLAIVIDSRLRASASCSEAELRQIIDRVVAEYRGYPAFAGFNLYDEPSADEFERLGLMTSILRDQVPEALAYVNLFPTYANPVSQLRTSTYEEYVDRFVAEVEPPLLSFDHYPLLEDDRGVAMTLDYFRNWAVIRRAALREAIPAWIFIQSVSYHSRRHPNEQEILWQVNASLAYGAKGIMYFTYWTPGVDSTEGFGSALISRAGERTPLYDAAKRVNLYLQAVGGELLALVSESVVHFGELLTDRLGVQSFVADDWVAAAVGDPVIISRFRDTPDNPACRWLLVVNRSFFKASETRLKLAAGVKTVAVFDAASGGYHPAATDELVSGELVVSLQPGAARLVRLEH